MVYDCFTFYNELDLLEIRLEELNEVVDYFVLVEARFTFQGKEKRFVFEDNKPRFQKFLHKIIHIKLDTIPEEYHEKNDKRWFLENYQRESIMLGLNKAQPDDMIMISDVDEIVKKNVIKQYNGTNNIIIPLMNIYLFYLNYKEIRKTNYKYYFLSLFSKRYKNKHLRIKFWAGSVYMKFKNFKSPLITRDIRDKDSKNIKLIENAGWHYTYQGGVEAIINKLKSFSHTEFNTEQFTNYDFIESQIKIGNKFLNFDIKLAVVSLVKNAPNFLIQNQKKFSHLLFK